ncbi:hypothetical protein BXZ70DRAFT_885133 [Cristinia sonorae]|uniref:BRCT domain-containing protein n=1 Tax=Cristinia sonorae TaxID=1940300 RepID=A0A8K0V005_9AGAR|nr:hypothetical protein BXZ70DRAFT_885133 [Cristinia sonorae]
MSTTPLPTKKIKMSSSTSRSGMIGATRVFALWKSNAQYYSGVVYSQADGADPRYLIRFDDDTEDTVDLPNIRQCILYEGDGVFLNQYNCKGRVTEVSGESLTVQARNKEPYRLTVSDIRIAAATVRNDWNDRKLTVDQIIPAVRPKYLVETPSKNSLASAGTAVSGSKQKMLSGVGLVVTLSPNNVEWEARKSEVMTAIKSKGGVVLEDWSDIFHLEGKVELSGRRWVARKEDVTLRRNFENVFLISDAYHQKPKYLIALALGIPCISAEWLVNEVSTWQWYLLPAGFSTQLHYRMSQLVNLDWGDEDRHLDRIMHNTAPPKIFMDLSILYVSTDFVAQVKNGRKAKTDAMLAQEANRTIPRILLCMGAKRVEAVASATDASQKPQKFDYVVVKEPHEVAQFSTKGTTCVHFKWVKDCLFSGRLLPHDFDYSA